MRPPVRYLRDDSGHRVAYTVHGEGPDLVLPAWWISHVEKDWDHPSYRAFLDALGEHFRVIRYDRLGVGLSDRDVATPTMDSEVRLLAAIIDTTVGHAKTSLFAFSSGCPVALAYAADNPDRIDRICIYGGYLVGADISAPDVQAAMIALVRAHWGAGSRAMADIFLPDQPREELDAASQQQKDSATADTAAALLELTYSMDASDRLPDISNELLVLHRTGDRAIPCEAGRRLASSLPGVPFVALDGRAHPPWVGDRQSILRLAVDFLAGGTIAAKPSQSSGDGNGFHLDVANRSLVINGESVLLTALEFGAMQHFVDNSDTVVTREALLEHVWKTPFAGSNKVDVLIRALRKKLADHARCIETVPGHGYRFSRRTEQ